MALTVLAAAGGLFGGDGWLGAAEASADADFRVRYARFGRAQAPDELVVEWVPREESASIWFTRPLADVLNVEKALPAAETVRAAADRIYYTFSVRDPGTLMVVRFSIEPTEAGRVSGHIGSGDGDDVAIRQFVFP